MLKVKQLSEKVSKNLETPITFNYVEISDGQSNKCVMIQRYFYQFAEKMRKFEVFEDDVWVVTFPKCGTTWAQEMVWMLNNNLDTETSYKVPQAQRFPFIE